jgi:hypothetical protein
MVDRVIPLPVSSEWRVEGDALSVRSGQERVTVRPVREADRAMAFHPPVPADVTDFPESFAASGAC